MSKDWQDYQDIWGLIRQKNGDEGDTLNRSCAKAVLDLLLRNPVNQTAFWKLGDGRGKFRRSDDESMWYGHYDRTSRDQLTPLVILAGLCNREELKSIFQDHLGRGLLFAYNTRRNFVYPTLEEHLSKSTSDVPWRYGWKLPDLTGPEFWALYIRGFNLRILYPLLALCDLHTLIGSVVIRLNKQNDVINHALILEYSRVRTPTFVSLLARAITPRAILQERLDRFFGREEEPPLNQLFSELK